MKKNDLIKHDGTIFRILATSKTLADELKTQWRKPILIMTTQRYFNLTRAEIMEFTRYSCGKRDKIIFDEKPYLIEQHQIDIGKSVAAC